MAVASGITVGWPSTVASIPSGWSRKADLNARYLRGAAASADADLSGFGSSTHTHTGDSHTPTTNAHTHGIDGAAASLSIPAKTGGSTTGVATVTHIHESGLTGSATSVLSAAAITVASFTNANVVANCTVVWIESDGSPAGLPNGCYAYFASDTLPASWSRVQGDRFLQGAAAGSGGGTTAGAATHTHTESGSHVHTESGTHTHTGTSSGPTGTASRTATGSTTAATNTHTHSLTIDANYEDSTSSTVVINSSNGEPPWKKLNCISNGTGGDSTPDQIICVWTSTHAGIPTNWARYTAMDTYFVKNCNADSEVGSTGGGTSHSHTATCTPQFSTTHDHTVSGASITGTVSLAASTAAASRNTHGHTWTIAYGSPTGNSCAANLQSCSSEAAYPYYQKVIFVQYTAPPGTHRFFMVM